MIANPHILWLCVTVYVCVCRPIMQRAARYAVTLVMSSTMVVAPSVFSLPICRVGGPDHRGPNLTFLTVMLRWWVCLCTLSASIQVRRRGRDTRTPANNTPLGITYRVLVGCSVSGTASTDIIDHWKRQARDWPTDYIDGGRYKCRWTDHSINEMTLFAYRRERETTSHVRGVHRWRVRSDGRC